MNHRKENLFNYPCQEHPVDCFFHSIELEAGAEWENQDKEANYLIFFLSGKAEILSNLFENTMIERGDIFFFPRLSDCRINVLEESKLLVHTFNNSSCNSTHCILSHLYIYSKNIKDDISYTCKLKPVPALRTYTASVLTYIEDKLDDASMWYTKHQEAIRLLKNYYKRDELRSFLYPMLHDSIPFKTKVLTHGKQANDVKELADLCGYGVVNFRRLFKEQFGIPVFQWIQQEKAKRIRYTLISTDLSIKEILNEYNFQSSSHFNKFCKRYLGETPSKIRKLTKEIDID